MGAFDQLYPYQRENVERLQEQRAVLIADEMGLGKTIQGVARDELIRKEHGDDKATLVIAPLSVLETWRKHFEVYTDLDVAVVDNKDRSKLVKRMFDPIHPPDVIVLHWEGLRLLRYELAKVHWGHIIADEAHRAQNNDAAQTRALKAQLTEYKTALSGTPITSKPDKFWSVLHWLYPKDWSSYWRFYGRYIEFKVVPPANYRVITGVKNEARLLSTIYPYYARHLKKKKCCPQHPFGVLPDLPDKFYSELEVTLDTKQRAAYEGMRKNLIAWVGANGDQPLAAPVVVAQLTRLAQLADAYMTVDATGKAILSDPSAKLDTLMELIRDNETEQIVVFSQFAQMIDLLCGRLAKQKITYAKLTGSVDQSLRPGLIAAFAAGERQVFATTIGAGGVGIDLTAASTAVFLDRSYSVALNAQAEDRLHRIGQRDNVQIIDIMAKNTTDRGRKTQLETKAEWLRKILGDSA